LQRKFIHALKSLQRKKNLGRSKKVAFFFSFPNKPKNVAAKIVLPVG